MILVPSRILPFCSHQAWRLGERNNELLRRRQMLVAEKQEKERRREETQAKLLKKVGMRVAWLSRIHGLGSMVGLMAMS